MRSGEKRDSLSGQQGHVLKGSLHHPLLPGSQDDADVEWTFARSKLYLFYF